MSPVSCPPRPPPPPPHGTVLIDPVFVLLLVLALWDSQLAEEVD